MTFRDVLAIDVMRRVWYAQVVSLFGDWLALFAVIAVVSFAMHGSPKQIIGVQIAYMLPIVFVGPVAGVFVDRAAQADTGVERPDSGDPRSAAHSFDRSVARLRR